MNKSKRQVLIEIEYMNRGLIPVHIKVDDIINAWTVDQLKVYHRKFRKIFRKALKWENQSIVSIHRPNSKNNIDKCLEKYIDVEYYKSFTHHIDHGSSLEETCYKQMMKSRRRLVYKFISHLVNQRLKREKK